MARYRTLKGEFWTHRNLARAPLHVGWLLGYIITAVVDDEGRFVPDAWDLHEKAFSSRHEITEDMTEEALQYLHNCGLVMLYTHEGERCGWLPGWFEHQYIAPRGREESSLPPPPVLLNSWERLTIIFDKYADYHGKEKTHYQTAARWFGQQDRDRQLELLGIDDPLQASLPGTGTIPVNTVTVPARREGNRTEGNGRGREARARPEKLQASDYNTGAPCADKPPAHGFGNGDVPDDISMRKQNNPNLWNAVFDLDWPMRTREKFFVGVLGAADGSDVVPRDEDHAVELVKQYPPEGTEQYFGKWLDRVKEAEELAGGGKYRGPGDRNAQPSSWEEALDDE